jgi:hypothetical protein
VHSSRPTTSPRRPSSSLADERHAGSPSRCRLIGIVDERRAVCNEVVQIVHQNMPSSWASSLTGRAFSATRRPPSLRLDGSAPPASRRARGPRSVDQRLRQTGTVVPPPKSARSSSASPVATTGNGRASTSGRQVDRRAASVPPPRSMPSGLPHHQAQRLSWPPDRAQRDAPCHISKGAGVCRCNERAATVRLPSVKQRRGIRSS